MKKSTKFFVLGGLLCALDIICTRFFYFYTPGATDRISLQFLPNAVGGMLFGPLWGGIICVVGDVCGMLINSGGFTFTPLISLACLTRGLLYGIVLHNKSLTFLRCFIAVALVTIVVELGIMPVALSLLYGRGWLAILISKVIPRLITIPAYSLVLFAVARALKRSGLAILHQPVITK
jgi:ECF transporter S component (folate family)